MTAREQDLERRVKRLEALVGRLVAGGIGGGGGAYDEADHIFEHDTRYWPRTNFVDSWPGAVARPVRTAGSGYIHRSLFEVDTDSQKYSFYMSP